MSSGKGCRQTSIARPSEYFAVVVSPQAQLQSGQLRRSRPFHSIPCSVHPYNPCRSIAGGRLIATSRPESFKSFKSFNDDNKTPRQRWSASHGDQIKIHSQPKVDVGFGFQVFESFHFFQIASDKHKDPLPAATSFSSHYFNPRTCSHGPPCHGIMV